VKLKLKLKYYLKLKHHWYIGQKNRSQIAVSKDRQFDQIWYSWVY